MKSDLSLPVSTKEFEGTREIAVEEVPICFVCGAENFSDYAYGYDYELLTCSNLWRFVVCNDCGFVWLNPRPAVSELSVIYPPSYYSYDIEASVNPIALKGKAFLDRMKFKSILRCLDRKPESYLDIGCGNGRYLKLMEEMCGIDRASLYGIELKQEPVEKLAREGYSVFHKRAEDVTEIEPESLDLIAMFHVIEHVADPSSLVGSLSRWLKPGGIAAIETPNIDSLDQSLFKETYWGGYHIPRHWTLFNQSTLTTLLTNQGLKVVAIKYQTGHAFWMFSFHHLIRYNSKCQIKWLAEWFNPFSGLPLLVSFTGFDILRKSLGFNTSTILILAMK